MLTASDPGSCSDRNAWSTEEECANAEHDGQSLLAITTCGWPLSMPVIGASCGRIEWNRISRERGPDSFANAANQYAKKPPMRRDQSGKEGHTVRQHRVNTCGTSPQHTTSSKLLRGKLLGGPTRDLCWQTYGRWRRMRKHYLCHGLGGHQAQRRHPWLTQRLMLAYH